MNNERVSSGLAGLDEVLHGGFVSRKSYLLQGGPGSGKSTFGYSFLADGAHRGGTSLLITLSEPKESIIENAAKQGIDLSNVMILDLSPHDEVFKESESYSVFNAQEVESEPIINSIIETVSQHKPDRVLLDSATMLQQLYKDTFQYRSMALSFIRYICSSGATLMMILEKDPDSGSSETEFWVDGVITLKNIPGWRRLQVEKFRGSDFYSGDHAFTLKPDGVHVFPRLYPGYYDRRFTSELLSSGVEQLDTMLYGGIEQGTITMITGPTGVGKTNLGIQFMKKASSRKERSVIFTFEESTNVLIERSRVIGVPIDDMLDSGKLRIQFIEPFSYSPDEFVSMVKHEVEQQDARFIMIDSVGGYNLSMREEDSLERLHALCIYMGNMGVTGLLVNETPNVTGEFVTTSLNASYLADNIIFLRYLEMNSELCKAIGILKKRLSDFEKSIREFHITSEGIKVGEPLKKVQGIMGGNPRILSNNE